MTVKSPVAGYLIGATYDVYTGRGWQQTAPNAPPVAGILEVLPEVYQARQNIVLTIEVDNPTDVVFYMGQPRSSSLRSTALFSSPMTFYLPLGAGSPSSVFPEDVQKLAGELGQSFTGSRGANELRRIASIPSQGFTLKRIVREGSRYRAVEVTRQEPEFQDVLGVRHLAGIKRKTVYSIESSVSTATHLVLGKAPTDYPGWVTDRYLQLPEDFPDSVKQLAREITGDAENPYEKALAIESYLRRLTYNTAINYPPADMDVVEYFLFDAPEGYCDYFASSMAVMLRSVGIPARIVAGYNNGEYDIEDDVYVIRESNAHSWPEVFFPGYGWVEFEPTPSQALPAHEPAPAYIEDEEE
ncbi:MAG: transglutaminase-like domain-containing protein, partial [Dehalococcoidia bacterium]|nr:transglutaminase-like domain-containing protein [Dehalococcoidia bacterium]